MGWHGPRDGYKSVAEAIADNFKPADIIEQAHSGAPGGGVGWVLLAPHVAKDGAPLIVCALVEGGLVKFMATTEGPFYYSVPLAWLDLAPERAGFNGNDHTWRESVKQWHAQGRGRALGVVVPSGGVSADD
jgi:hypothetical protein